jgi:hypothetical protein
MIAGEASTNTLYSYVRWQERIHFNISAITPHVSRIIHATNPETRIITILRDPVRRLLSSFVFFSNRDHFNASHNMFEQRVKEGLMWLNNCFQRHDHKHCLYEPVPWDKWNPVREICHGIYAEYLEDWFKVFPQKQVMVINNADFANNSARVVNRVYEFLQVGTVPQLLAERLKHTPKTLATRSEYYAKLGRVDVQVINMLYEFYQPFNDKLAKLLNNTHFNYNIHRESHSHMY